MKFILLLLIGFSLTFMSFAQDEISLCQQSKIKQFNSLLKADNIAYPGDFNYDVKYYKLDIALTYIPQNIKGAVTVNAAITSDSINTVFLDIVDALVVDSVKLNSSLTSFTHQEDKLNINLNAPHNTGDQISIIVYYHGKPVSSGFNSFVFGLTPIQNQPLIYTLSEPYGAKDWWPCKDTPADKADSADIWLTVSTDLIPVSNGKLMDTVNNGDGTHTYKWKESYPIAQYLLSLAITNYTEYVNYYKYSPTDSMPVTNYVYPENFTTDTKSQLDITPKIISVYAQRFGQYPFLREKYGHAQFGWGGGMEHQTISSMTSFGESLVSHELAHQWYGDAITCKDWQNIWLNEGFATYAEGVWKEAQYGQSSYNDFIVQKMSSAKYANGSIYVEDISSVDNIFNYNRSYAKGAVVLHMLRGIVGDSTFFDILRTYTYYPTVAYGVATTEDFQFAAESVSGLDLDYFFQQWIYGYNYPKYSIVWNKNKSGGGLWNLSVKITQQVNPKPSFFTMPVQIKINYSIDSDTLITVFNNAQTQDFNITLNKEPLSIEFDPNNYILKDVSLIVSGIEEANVLNSFSLKQNYPNPFNPGTKIKYTVASSKSSGGAFVKLKIFDLLGNEVATLVDEYKNAGNYEVDFNSSVISPQLASGVYFYQLKAGDYIQTRKMILMR